MISSKLANCLAGITEYEPKTDDSLFTFENVSAGNYDPPAYIVAFIFLHVLKYKNYGRFEKIWWHTYFTFKDLPFMVRDYKFGSWSLESRSDLSAAKKLVPELQRRIKAASHYADRLLQREFQKEIDKGAFYIKNVHGVLSRTYGFYLKELRSSLRRVHLLRDRKPESTRMKGTVAIHDKLIAAIERLTYRAIPLMITFFSMTEFLFDTFYAFSRPGMSFTNFRNMSWSDRFKIVVPIRTKQIRNIYERLLSVRKQFRNPLTHGLTNESSLLVPFPFAGLVPISYEHLKKSIHYSFSPISLETAEEIACACEDFLEFVRSEKPFAYYILFAEHGFSIPFEEQAVRMVKSEMTSIAAFKNYLQERVEYQDAVTNRDI